MQYKDNSLIHEMEQVPCFLAIIVYDFAQYAAHEFNVEVTITRVLEAVCGSSGVHEAHRGIDIRDQHNDGYTFTEPQRNMLIGYINSRYPRYDGKLTCIWHSFQGAPYHFHFQVASSMDAYIRKEQ